MHLNKINSSFYVSQKIRGYVRKTFWMVNEMWILYIAIHWHKFYQLITLCRPVNRWFIFYGEWMTEIIKLLWTVIMIHSILNMCTFKKIINLFSKYYL